MLRWKLGTLYIIGRWSRFAFVSDGNSSVNYEQ